jgi:hypothetical protein
MVAIFAFLLLFLLHLPSWAVTVNWDDPNEGDPRLQGFRIYYGTVSQPDATQPADGTTASPYEHVIDIADANARTHVLNLGAGTYYARMVAYGQVNGVTQFSPFTDEQNVVVGDPSDPAPDVVGMPAVISWGSAGNPPAQSITVPPDTTVAYLFWSYQAGGSGNGVLDLVLNGQAPDRAYQLTTSGGLSATGVAAFYLPTIGAGTIDLKWKSKPEQGPNSVIVFAKNSDMTGWRDVQAARASGTTQVEAVVASSPTDLVIKYDRKYTTNSTSFPGTSPDWTSLQTGFNNKHAFRLSKANAPGAASTTALCENESASSVLAISIR